MLTNFHLPRSTLLVLVSAFAGRELVLRAYEEAVAQRYRVLQLRRRHAHPVGLAPHLRERSPRAPLGRFTSRRLDAVPSPRPNSRSPA